jgi:hypothetical protein
MGPVCWAGTPWPQKPALLLLDCRSMTDAITTDLDVAGIDFGECLRPRSVLKPQSFDWI